MNNNFIHYVGNNLCIEGLKVSDIIEQVKTPAYLYSANRFKYQLNNIKQAFKKYSHMICLSVKSCHNINIIKLFKDEGCGIDVVSYGELYRGLKAEMQPKKIVYSGVGKTEDEIISALEAGILMFNIESLMELERINLIACKMNKKAPIAFRINPNVDAKTHPYITTGLNNNKFGIDHTQIMDAYRIARQMEGIEIIGIDFHIGSQLLDVSPFYDTALIVAGYIKALKNEGITIKYVDVGGGLGIPYTKNDKAISVEEYANSITSAFKEFEDITIILEMGRFLVGQAGMLVSKVEYIKENSIGKKFVIVDSGMHHLIRTPLYGAYHKILPVEKQNTEKEIVSVVGPICESTDFFAKDYELEGVKQNDLLAVLNAGAYGIVLSSNYNSHLKPTEVLVDKDNFKVIRKKETYSDMIVNEII